LHFKQSIFVALQIESVSHTGCRHPQHNAINDNYTRNKNNKITYLSLFGAALDEGRATPPGIFLLPASIVNSFRVGCTSSSPPRTRVQHPNWFRSCKKVADSFQPLLRTQKATGSFHFLCVFASCSSRVPSPWTRALRPLFSVQPGERIVSPSLTS